MTNLRKTYIVIFLAIIVTITMPGLIVSAESLWNDTGSGASLFSDRKAHAVGDIITIIISESSSASRAGTASNSKSASTEMDAGVGIFNFLASASGDGKDSFKAQGTTTNTNKVTAKMTVQVIEVKPNGNMLISGTQSVKQNNEEQRITVSGVVRAEDVTPDNTVLSSYIADAKISMDGKGPIANKQKQGILTQIFNFLF